MSIAPPERLWRLHATTTITEQFDDSLVVFDPATGETHFLADLPALVLAELDDEPRSVRELIERLAGPVELDRAAEQQILTALTQLEAAELVESRAPKPD